MIFSQFRYGWILLACLPLVAFAQFVPPPSLEVLTPDQIFEELGIPARVSDVTSFLQVFGSDLWSQFMASRGGEVLLDIKIKTGIDLEKFFSFVFNVAWYLFLQIYAALTDIAAKLSTPR